MLRVWLFLWLIIYVIIIIYIYHYVSLLILLIVQLTFSLVTSHFFGCKVPGGDLSIEWLEELEWTAKNVDFLGRPVRHIDSHTSTRLEWNPLANIRENHKWVCIYNIYIYYWIIILNVTSDVSSYHFIYSRAFKEFHPFLGSLIQPLKTLTCGPDTVDMLMLGTRKRMPAMKVQMAKIMIPARANHWLGFPIWISHRFRWDQIR